MKKLRPTTAVELLFEHLTELGIRKDYHEITGAGHRVVAGELFKESALINTMLSNK